MFASMFTSIKKIFTEIFAEYKQLFLLVFRVLALVFVCFAFSFALVFPLWTFATKNAHLFSVCAVSIFFAFLLFFCIRQTTKSIKTNGVVFFLMTLLQIVFILAGIAVFFAMVIGGGGGSRIAAFVCLFVTLLIYGALQSGKRRLKLPK